MELPFTTEEFLNIFKTYNQSVFPLQIVFNLTAFYSIYLIFKTKSFSGRFISSTLVFLWLWIGIVYHLIFFTNINNAAYFFGAIFIIQGVLFFIFGFYKTRFSFSYKKDFYGIIGLIFFMYALIIYPVLGHLLGHQYPYSPTFGLPCPTTIFTFGVLLYSEKRIPFYLIFIPLIWSIIGFGAALNLSIYEDFGLLLAGIIGTILIVTKNRKLPKVD
ncbi:hypothetical protein ASZ90_003157 [hydrocarbon metagenome]|uniref:Uncharacterized protein n=1 Tax=hydrocarbon metagenome TaxID=938273 RepID=A0A0W8G1V8_9ZZZZ